MDKTSKVSAESSGGKKKKKVVNLKEDRPTHKSPLSNYKDKLSQTLAIYYIKANSVKNMVSQPAD